MESSTSAAEAEALHLTMLNPPKAALEDAPPGGAKGKGGKNRKNVGQQVNPEDGSAVVVTPDAKAGLVTAETPNGKVPKTEKAVTSWIENGTVNEKKFHQWAQNLEKDLSEARLLVPKLQTQAGTAAKRKMFTSSADIIAEHVRSPVEQNANSSFQNRCGHIPKRCFIFAFDANQ